MDRKKLPIGRSIVLVFIALAAGLFMDEVGTKRRIGAMQESSKASSGAESILTQEEIELQNLLFKHFEQMDGFGSSSEDSLLRIYPSGSDRSELMSL